MYNAAVGNQSRIVIALGISAYSGGQTAEDRMEYITCSTAGNGTNFGNLTQGKYSAQGASNGTRGVFFGGLNTSGSYINVLDYITIASTGDATDFGDLVTYGSYSARARGAVISNATRGVMAGGASDAAGAHPDIQYITIATAGNATDFANLTRNVTNTSGCSDLTRGLIMGGSAETGGTGNLSEVNEYITIDTLADAADFGNLTYTSQGAAACADNTYGCHYGGYGNGFAEVNQIDRCTIQTLGNSVDHGDLTNTLGLYTQGASGNAA
jgi:hypothetical protein